MTDPEELSEIIATAQIPLVGEDSDRIAVGMIGPQEAPGGGGSAEDG